MPRLPDALLAPVLRLLLRVLVKPVFAPAVPVERQRRRVAALAVLHRLPCGIRPEAARVAGIPGEWLRPAHPPAKAGRVLYLHGGGFRVGSPATHRALAARLARDTGLPVFVPDYRLAPEHPFPAPLEDARAAYEALAAGGAVLLVGDSAGGALAVLLAQSLRDAGGRAPAALLLVSPLLDLTLDGVPAHVPGECLLGLPWLREGIDAFRGAIPADDPRVSPWHGALAGLPPTMLLWGSDELLAGPCARFLDRLRQASVVVEGEAVPGRWHAFPLHAGSLPSADAAIARLARFALAPLEAATPPRDSRHAVVVLGAGMSGLCMARQLKHAGLDDVLIIEKQAGLGGTWWDNRFPGAQVDVPAPAYAFSFFPQRRARQRFADAADIQAYQQALAEEAGLLAHLRLGVALTEARYDEAAGEWCFRTGKGDRLRARFFVCSTGPLSQPRWPDLLGLADFRGERLHSARWDPTLPLAGRRIGVVGTGATGVQLIPRLAAVAGQLTVFQRTPNWILPRLDRRYTTLDRLLARVPGYLASCRLAWGGFLELNRLGFEEGSAFRRFLLWLAARHRRAQVADPALRAALTPDYPLGCRRIIYANDYYPALQRPGVRLETAAIDRVEAKGIRTRDGRLHPLDVLVCATGFDTVHLLSSLAITGRGGTSLAEAWREGPEAYRGTTVSGFPNLFLLLGPNTATGHTSTLFYIEAATAHAIACMRRVLAEGHRSIEVREEVQRAHNATLQSRLGASVWAQCRSWYRAEGGRIVALFPGHTPEYVRGTRRPHWPDYRFD